MVGKHDVRRAEPHPMHPALAPFQFRRGGLRVKNRCVLAAMTNKQSQNDGQVTQEEIAWLEARSRGGFGIVTTAATHVQEDGQGWEGEFGVWSDEFLPGLTTMATAITKHGSIGLAQLFHGGMRAPESLTGQQPKSASENLLDEEGNVSRAMTDEEVHETIRAFGQAAKRCEAAGFHGVELHGAHGYLISQFLGEQTNRREDAWGGSSEKRQAFLVETVKEVRRQTRENFVVGVRLSPVHQDVGITIQDALFTLNSCMTLELDFIHVSCWDIHQSVTIGQEERTLTEWFAHELKGQIPLITTGGLWNRNDAAVAMDQGGDFVGVARAGIAHPNWPEALANDADAPKRPPFSSEELQKASLSPRFIAYMRRWEGFVED